MKFIKRMKFEKHRPLQTKKEISSKTARMLVWGAAVVVVGLLPVTVIKANQAVNQGKQVQEEAVQLVEQATTDLLGQSVSGSPLFQRWTDPFIDTYMTIPTDDSAFVERKEKLTKMMATDIGELVNNGVSQRIVKKELYDLKTAKDFLIAVYRVEYEITTPVQKERTVEKNKKKVKETYTDYETTKRTVLVNVPFQEFDGQFKVMAMPYYTNETGLTKEEVSAIEKEKNLDSLTKEETSDVAAFIAEFLKKYCGSTIEDMQYLMEQPEIVTGYDLADFKAEVKGKDGQYIAYLTLFLQDKDTQLVHAEQMSLLIVKKEKTYFVEKLTHYLGGL